MWIFARFFTIFFDKTERSSRARSVLTDNGRKLYKGHKKADTELLKTQKFKKSLLRY